MTKVLIVYENIPESTDLFIVDANECEVKDLELSHGNEINACDDEAIEKAMTRISLRLGSKDSDSRETREWCELPTEDVAKWDNSAIEKDDPINVKEHGIELVIVTGFLM